MNPGTEHAIVKAVLYAMRSGCFHPVPEPPVGATTDEWIRWGAMRNLHDAVAALAGEGAHDEGDTQ